MSDKFCKIHNYDYGDHFEFGCPTCAEPELEAMIAESKTPRTDAQARALSSDEEGAFKEWHEFAGGLEQELLSQEADLMHKEEVVRRLMRDLSRALAERDLALNSANQMKAAWDAACNDLDAANERAERAEKALEMIYFQPGGGTSVYDAAMDCVDRMKLIAKPFLKLGSTDAALSPPLRAASTEALERGEREK